MNPGRIDQRGRFNLTGGVTTMSGSLGAARDSAAFVPLVLQIRCFGVCNRWAKNAPIGIDRGTADWLRDDARLAAPNTYGAFWDAAIVATGSWTPGAPWSSRTGRGDNGGVGATDRRAAVRATRERCQSERREPHRRARCRRLSRAPGASGLSIIDL